MEKQLTLAFILVIQPVFAYFLWLSMNKLLTARGLKGTRKAGFALNFRLGSVCRFLLLFCWRILADSSIQRMGF